MTIVFTREPEIAEAPFEKTHSEDRNRKEIEKRNKKSFRAGFSQFHVPFRVTWISTVNHAAFSQGNDSGSLLS